MTARIATLVLGLLLAAGAGAESLRAQLEDLAAEHGFELRGSHHLEGDAVPDAGGPLRARLDRLLVGYAHVLIQAEGEPVRRIVVTGRNGARPVVNAHRIGTRRHGGHHVVSATLVGPAGDAVDADLVVDTGATTIVLPASLIEPLGFVDEELDETWAQTANGKVPVRIGRLSQVRLGTAGARDVTASFVEDERLGDQALLGISFLGQFRVTLDDAGNRLILMAR